MNEDKIFIDTNILVYAHDVDARERHRIAQAVLTELWEKRTGALSVRVLQEFTEDLKSGQMIEGIFIENPLLEIR